MARRRRAGLRLRSSGGPRRLPLGPGELEAGPAARLEDDDLGGSRRLLRPRGDPHEMEMHLLLLSVVGRLAAPSSQRAP